MKIAWVALLSVSPLLATCGGNDGPVDPTPGDGPAPGTLTVRLAGSGSVGAVVVEVEGPVADITAASQVEIESFSEGSTHRVLAWGGLHGRAGPVFAMRVPDVGNPDQYRVRVLQVADRDTFEQFPIEEWSLSVGR